MIRLSKVRSLAAQIAETISANSQDIRSTALQASVSKRTAPDGKLLAASIREKLVYGLGKSPEDASKHDWLQAVSLAVRDKIMDRWLDCDRQTKASGGKQVCYLSMEFLIGRVLRDAVGNLGLTQPLEAALSSLGAGDLVTLADLEPDPALGNGGLGRLAACYLESMATVGIPAFGYGIRYDHGLFRQGIKDGQQTERPENWLKGGNPWEVARREASMEIGFGGVAETGPAPWNQWRPGEVLRAVAYDMPVVGWRGTRVNTLRLWHAEAPSPLRLDQFNGGDHIGAQYRDMRAASINKVLYPSDATPAGQELRLRQEYFFTSASLQDLLKRHVVRFGDVLTLADKAAIQLNDTHPAIAVAELMRLLMDVYGLGEAPAWDITRKTISYTNHTLLPEALESWSVHLMQHLLPRHMQIIYALDERLAADVEAKAPGDEALKAAVAIVDKRGDWRVRMGHLAFAGSHNVNGVSQLHTDLMKVSVFQDLDRLYPGRIVNKTNGVTPRRWLQEVNPGLTALIRDAIGDRVLDDLGEISKLKPFAKDSVFRSRFANVKLANKARLAAMIQTKTGTAVDPASLFDVHIKRIHEYKRQLLNLLQTVALYQAMRANPSANWTPRVKIFAGKAAPSYIVAKQIIHLINDVAATINADTSLRGALKVVFIPNYNVSLAEMIVPAADLSEQISTAGMEASGTGNMKFALNGALTIGTLDGANVEISEHVGLDDIVIFGLTAAEVAARRVAGHDPRGNIERSAKLKGALDAISAGTFSGGDRDRYRYLVEGLYAHDWFMLTSDFDSYDAAQARVDALWLDPARWQASLIRNTAGVGWFSSDRAVREYARDIWNVPTT